MSHQRGGSAQVRNPPWLWNPGQTSPEVQNRGISGSTKRTCVLQKNFETKVKNSMKKSVPIYCYNFTTRKLGYFLFIAAALWSGVLLYIAFIRRSDGIEIPVFVASYYTIGDSFTLTVNVTVFVSGTFDLFNVMCKRHNKTALNTF